jgi:two-component system phosphate regulon response regulator PhoB
VIRLASEEKPDLIVLDWMLPGMSGIEVCRMLRSKTETRDVPIVMLTARGEETERVRGLATGADDYIVKPFSVPELLARVKTILRRSNPSAVAETLKAGELTLNRKTRRVTRSTRDINLSPTEFRLLEHLMANAGRVYSRSQLLDAVWGRDNFVDERTVDVHVGRLRSQIKRGREIDPIRTVRGMGYSFDERFGR